MEQRTVKFESSQLEKELLRIKNRLSMTSDPVLKQELTDKSNVISNLLRTRELIANSKTKK